MEVYMIIHPEADAVLCEILICSMLLSSMTLQHLVTLLDFALISRYHVSCLVYKFSAKQRGPY